MSKPLEPRSIKDYARLIRAVETLEDMTALSMFQGGDPGYLDSPKEWLQNTSYDDIKPEKANE